MKKPLQLISLSVIGLMNLAQAGEQPALSKAVLRESGVFEFPQKQATVLCDRSDLRFSVWNNQEYLFAQAIVWNDNDSSLGKSEENREIGDWSQVMLDLDADQKPSAKVDRNYMLNPWPTQNGLHYDVCLGNGVTTPIEHDSKGRGAIRYLDLSEGTRVRVDTYLIPLTEISKKPGEKIRLCYWGFSPKPAMTLDSAGFGSSEKTYYGYSVPLAKYQDYLFSEESGEIDATKVPEGRNDISLSNHKKVDMPTVGQMAPEISAKEWLNLKSPPTLASLRGKVVLLEFWATWCGPCVEGIPHLNTLQSTYAGKNFQLLTFVEEGHKTMDRFLKRVTVEYPVGLESPTLDDYGIEAIPHAFLVGPDGKIIWEGHPTQPAMESAISEALGKLK